MSFFSQPPPPYTPPMWAPNNQATPEWASSYQQAQNQGLFPPLGYPPPPPQAFFPPPVFPTINIYGVGVRSVSPNTVYVQGIYKQDPQAYTAMPAGCTAEAVYKAVKKQHSLVCETAHLIYPSGQIRKLGDCHNFERDSSFDSPTVVPIPFFGSLKVGHSNALPPGLYTLQIQGLFGKVKTF